MANLILGFWIILILFILFIFISVIAGIIVSLQTPEAHDALFRITELVISHQGSTQMDVLIHNVYKPKANFANLPTYVEIQQTILTVMGSPSFQSDHPWEAVAQDIGKQIFNDYDVIGTSVEIIIPAGDSLVNMSAATYTRGYASRVLKFGATEQ
jgi:hypothetical protein